MAAAMTAAEITEGLSRLGILHQTTLPYSPYQMQAGGVLGGPVEGGSSPCWRMSPISHLAVLNEATQAWWSMR